jgi:hypothetical protein
MTLSNLRTENKRVANAAKIKCKLILHLGKQGIDGRIILKWISIK